MRSVWLTPGAHAIEPAVAAAPMLRLLDFNGDLKIGRRPRRESSSLIRAALARWRILERAPATPRNRRRRTRTPSDVRQRADAAARPARGDGDLISDPRVNESHDEQRRQQVHQPVRLRGIRRAPPSAAHSGETERQAVGDAEGQRDGHHRQERRNRDAGIAPGESRPDATSSASPPRSSAGAVAAAGNRAYERRDEQRQDETARRSRWR